MCWRASKKQRHRSISISSSGLLMMKLRKQCLRHLKNVGGSNPMNGNILDTNVIIRLLNGDENVRSAIYKMTDICIPVVVVGELLFGAEKSQKREQNRRNYLAFCAPYPVFGRNAESCGRVRKTQESFASARQHHA